MKSYSDRLPRKSSGKICQALDMNGNKCRRKATIETSVHCDSEVYYGSNGNLWVAIHLCEKCAKEYNAKQGLTFIPEFGIIKVR